MKARIVLVLAAACINACTLGPNFVHPGMVPPSTWSTPTRLTVGSQPVEEPVDVAWWALFGDPVLTRLAERVAAENLDVESAMTRIAESRAQRGISAADIFPTLHGNGSYTREKQSAKGVVSLIGGGDAAATQANGLGGRQAGTPASSLGGTLLQPFNLFQGGFDASWELDLWGRVRREVESADASVRASAEAARDTFVSITAEIARDYFELRGTQDQILITAENLNSARESARLTQERQIGGIATELDVANAEAQVNEIESQALPLEQQESLLINAIGFLLSQKPNVMRDELRASSLISAPVRVPIGLPSELAQRRPDIRRAEANLHSATANIGIAKADFYPRITLSGSSALQAVQFKDLGNWDARTYGFGPSVSVPLFEGARLTRTLELRQAQQREAAITYQRTVLNAWREVDDALTAYETEQRRKDRIVAQASNADRALQLARARYAQGISNYLDVLTARRTLLLMQLNLSSSSATVNADLVTLYKALGGGWESRFPQEPF